MVTKKKEIIFTKLAERQLLEAKHNSTKRRGNSNANTKKYFQGVMKDIRTLATGKKLGTRSQHSAFFTMAKAGDHNVMLFETKTTIYIVGFIHPEQDSRAKLIDEELLLNRLGTQKYTARLNRQRKIKNC